MKFKRFSILSLLFLFGCNLTTSYEVKLKQDTFEYKEKTIDVCQYIEKIEDTKVKDYNRKKGRITETDYSVTRPTHVIKKLGKQEVNIKINDIEIPIQFTVVDTTSPAILFEKNEFEVEEGNTYFDIKKLITVEDNYDTKPIVTWTGDYDIKTPGSYQVEVKAKDASGNASKKKFKIHITEKEIEVIEKETIIHQENNSNTSTIPNHSNTQTKPTNPSLPPKSFLFKDGYDMKTGFNTCQEYRDSAGASGKCSPLLDDSGIPYGYEFIPN